MSYKLDFTVGNSEQIEGALCERLKEIRLSRNITQAMLAQEAGVSLRTITRMEKGLGISFDTFIRVLMALGIQQNLGTLLPDPTIRPIERIGINKTQRKRARPSSTPAPAWTWGDSEDDNDK